jgi:hypothetical protein
VTGGRVAVLSWMAAATGDVTRGPALLRQRPVLPGAAGPAAAVLGAAVGLVAAQRLHREAAGGELGREQVGFCREALPAFKRPRKVLFVSVYPTTATGKVRRVELRVMADAALRDQSALNGPGSG